MTGVKKVKTVLIINNTPADLSNILPSKNNLFSDFSFSFNFLPAKYY